MHMDIGDLVFLMKIILLSAKRVEKKIFACGQLFVGIWAILDQPKILNLIIPKS
jgi:hypothetical protein